MNTLTKAQKESFVKIIEDIVEQARIVRIEFELRYKYSTRKYPAVEYKHSINDITREALENFEDELGESKL